MHMHLGWHVASMEASIVFPFVFFMDSIGLHYAGRREGFLYGFV